MTHAITNLPSGAGLCRGSLTDSVPFTCWEEMKRRQINWLSGLWLCSDLRGWELSAWGSDGKPHLFWSLRGHVLAARQESVGQVCLSTRHTLSLLCVCVCVCEYTLSQHLHLNAHVWPNLCEHSPYSIKAVVLNLHYPIQYSKAPHIIFSLVCSAVIMTKLLVYKPFINRNWDCRYVKLIINNSFCSSLTKE